MKKKTKYITISIFITIYLIGAYVLRTSYRDSWEFPNGEELGPFTIGFAELVSPFWVPPLVIGEIIILGL